MVARLLLLRQTLRALPGPNKGPVRTPPGYSYSAVERNVLDAVVGETRAGALRCRGPRTPAASSEAASRRKNPDQDLSLYLNEPI